MTTKIPVELSSTPGIVDGSNATAITINSSEQVGIGTTSPSRIFDVENSSASALCSIVSGTALKAGFVFGDTSADDQGGIVYDNNGDYLFFRAGGAERARILSGGGITFNGDTAAANALDDYEEGTWTPVFGGNISATGQSYSVQEGSYTKIGRQVTCRFKVQLSAEGTFENVYILLQGFPFALASSPGTTHLCNMYFTTLGSNYISLGLQGHEGNAQAFIWAKTTASDNREYLGKTDLTNTSQLTGTFTYFV